MTISLGYVTFYVSDVPAALQFYSSAFGFEVAMVTPEGDYGELVTGQTTLGFVAEALATSNLDQAGGYRPHRTGDKPAGSTAVLVTDDVAAAVASAVSQGAKTYVEPIAKPWGQTVAYVIDPFGILIELATPVSG